MKGLRANVEVARSAHGFDGGLLVDLLTALRRTAIGELVGLTSDVPTVGPDLERWARFTGNSIVQTTIESDGATRWVVRNGPAPPQGDGPAGALADDAIDLTSRLWLYTNFDCNLRCDYCCVRSSPVAPRRELGLHRVRRVAAEARALGVRQIFVTGGEPLLLTDIADILSACLEAAPTTLLTNGMLLKGACLEALRALPRDRLALQISLDSPTPELHDLHRGAGTWARAWRGVEVAQRERFRVRLAATVSSDADEARFRAFLDEKKIAHEDRVVRRTALRGFAEDGVALARADLVPEVTITADGVYWHPVAADDPDMAVTRDVFPLVDAIAAVRVAFARERASRDKLASLFHCA